MNSVMLMGRPTKKPEIRTANDLVIASWTMAVNRQYVKNPDDQSADFIFCKAFGKTAEFVEKYIDKGTKILLDGRIQTGSYTNRNGERVYTTEVIVNHMEFAESKKQSSSVSDIPDNKEDFMNIPDGIEEDLPFV